MRHEDWQRRFWAEIEVQSKEHFEWGKRDCVLSATRLIESISPDGYMEKLKTEFSWDNQRQAVKLINGSSLVELVCKVMGKIQPIVVLSMGDLALVIDDDGRESLAVHDGAQYIGPAEVGFRRIPYRCLIGGWRVR